MENAITDVDSSYLHAMDTDHKLLVANVLSVESKSAETQRATFEAEKPDRCSKTSV